MVHCIYERVIKLKRNLKKKLYCFLLLLLLFTHPYQLLQNFEGSVSIWCTGFP